MGRAVSLALAVALAGCGPRALDGDAAGTRAIPAARLALGAARPYPAAPLAPAEVETMRTSLAARRRLGWSVAARAVAPVEVAGGAVPRFLTWYAKDDVQRLFRKLYDDLGRGGRALRRALSPEAIVAAEAWNAAMVRELPTWPQSRLDAWLAALADGSRRQGLAGLGRTLFSPDAARRLLFDYAGVARCPGTADAAALDAPGRSEDNFTLCFSAEMPAGAAIVKTSWRRVGFDMRLPTYATDAATLTRRLGDVSGAWGAGDGTADPGADEIFTMETESGARYRLAGLHVMTKEQREWVWVTLWWSPAPDEDFGEDRPADEPALAGPWRHYKMCVVTAFDERAAPDDAWRARHPSLAAASEAAIQATRPYSWCSNPYIEEGSRNHVSQCIGCHQHGGGTLASETVLSDEARFPGAGRARVRASFPADYLWSLGRLPEEMSSDFAERMRYYDLYDRSGR